MEFTPRTNAPKLTMPLSKPAPVRMDWVARAALLPGKALHVAMTLWWLVCTVQSAEVRINRSAMARFGVSRDACYDALRHLETANLVRVHRLPGRRPTVTLLDSATRRPLRLG